MRWATANVSPSGTRRRRLRSSVDAAAHRYAEKVGVDGAAAKNGDVVALDRGPYLSVNGAHRAVGDGGQDRVLGETEVTRIVAHVDAIDPEPEEGPQTDLGEDEGHRIATLEPFRHRQGLVIFEKVLVENQDVRQITELRAEGELNGLTTEVAMAVFERRAYAFASRKTRAKVEVLRDALLHLDDDHFAFGGNLRVLERDGNARESSERGDALFALAHVAGAERLALVDVAIAAAAGEGEAPRDERWIRTLGAAHDDAVDVDTFPFANDETGTPARAVGGKIEDRAHVGEGETLLPEGVLHAPARRLERRLRNRSAQIELGLFGEITLDEDLISFEGDVVEHRARAEFDGDAQMQTGLARHAFFGIGDAEKARIGRRFFEG
jgi:hypothetical protein